MPGVGKKTIVKAVAKRCRMHVVEVKERFDTYLVTLHVFFMQFNCYEFTSDSVPFAEKKMTNDLNTGQSCPDQLSFCDYCVVSRYLL